jgi:hypothetical protein
MKQRKFDFRINLLIDTEFEEALDAARLPRRMSKTAYIRDVLVNDLIARGLLKTRSMGNAR